jgi:4-hydroxy-tetrahydrodipicolinate reductase
MERKIRVIQYGVGVIGAGAVKLMLQKPALQLVGAVDSDPEKIGRDLGRVIGLDRDLGVIVQRDLKAALPASGADVAVHMTRPKLAEAAMELRDCVAAGLHVVSACEELCYPFRQYPELSRDLDAEARAKNVVLLGVGVNPGFVMDKLVLMLATACHQVNKVRVLRVVDASRRRLRLQKKIGVGLTLEQFGSELEAGAVRNYGASESVWMLADHLGIPIDRVEEAIAPIVAEMPMRTQYFQVKAGQVKGLKQVALGLKDNEENIRLELEMYLGAAESLDSVKITGVPNLEMKVPGGIHGDLATTAIVVNCIPNLVELAPGLRVVTDMPMAYWPGSLAMAKAANIG